MAAWRRDAGPWYGNDRERVRFEGAARLTLPGLRVRGGVGWTYSLRVEVPHYVVQRDVTIAFSRPNPRVPKIRASGPSESPHRFDDGALCVWDPRGPANERWQFGDGLLHLIGLVVQHLFKEEWWREYKEWLGPEAPHADGKLTVGAEARSMP